MNRTGEMSQQKRNLGAKLSQLSNENCNVEKDRDRIKKVESIVGDSKNRQSRFKAERLQTVSSYLEVSDTQESTLSMRLNQFPMRPQYLIGKDPSRSLSRRRRKSVSEKRAEKIKEENSEGSDPSARAEEKVESDCPTGVQTSESSLEKVLNLCRTRLQSLDDRRNEIFRSMPMSKTKLELINHNATESGVYGKATNPKNANEKFSGHHLSKRPSPVMDSYFNFNRPPWQNQQKATSEFQTVQSDWAKANINQILKGHAQKMSGHSLKLGSLHNAAESFGRMRIPRKEGSRKSSPVHSTKNFQKVIEIQTRDENKRNEESERNKIEEKKVEKEEKSEKKVAKEEKPEEKKVAKEEKSEKKVAKEEKVEEKKVAKEEKSEEKKDPVKTEVEKQDSGSKATERKDTEKKDVKESEETVKGEGTPAVKKHSEERVSDMVKRVTYTDRLLLNRFRKDSTEKIKTPGAIIASVIEKLNSPFKDEMQKRLENCLNGKSKKPEEATEQKSVVKTSSDAALKPTVQKQRSAREATIDDQVNKSVEQLGKTKYATSSELRDIVAQAIKEHKIFCIFDNHWYINRPVREELLNRGWLEVIPDRRLIPRRRPPPAGPTMDRNGTPDYVIQAILTAKEAIVDDYIDVISKFPPAKIAAEKPKPQRKTSEDSLKETYSEFRIVPPASDKKKTNQDIRDFVGKCHQMGLRKQYLRQGKDKKGKLATVRTARNGKVNPEEEAEESQARPSASEMNYIFHTVQQNRKILGQLPGLETPKEKPKEEPRPHVPAEVSVKESKILLSENDAKIASKIIQSSNARIHFMWLSIKPAIHLKCFSYSPEIVNKFQRTSFCTKIGLWSHLNNIQWYAHEVTFPAKSPRMYNTGEAEDLQAFFQDFQMTACIGILKWLSETFFDKGIKGVQKKKGKVPIKAFEFAIRQCERYIRFRENDDLNLLEDPKVMQEEWNNFLQWFYVITNDHGKVQETSNAQLMVVYTKAVEVLRAMKRHWPEIDIDGRLNIWIMKPYCASCGRGIFMTNNVYYIGQHSKYIVQKYIERPLLIYNTKFDIRQWFMITKLMPLEIWMYKECYLRFCTQPFVLRNLHESVHLSNNSVQRKYLNQKDSGLPDQNMWDSNTFQQYLKTIGQPNVWNEVIYPGMRDAIISLMLASQDTFDNQRRSWFEVYGADFMISSNPKDGPWLIEINESPAMDPSTKVTAKLCPQMLRDVIKVVVDRRSNKNALTGQWELVYRQNYSPSYGTISIDVKGKRIARAPQNKTGYNTNWGPPPSYFNTSRSTKENSTEREDPRKYEILKSYTSGRAEINLDKATSGMWGSRVKPRLIKETSTKSLEG